ncbi:ArnT family glycosyltransferase [Novosphingobium sp. M1R2S20]|uniref:ArnT family glycosyltransferase n=1 Tax=Novosphingobium rhizovicinum TaxID=3228928 RepID=A0ABV3RD49_9SPHN
MAVRVNSLRLLTPVGFIAAITLLLRAGSFWGEQIDWDEWSFILMGADVARGHLPFVHQFDLKPPLVFFAFGATIALFGKSLLAIRLLGALCVFTSAVLVFLITRRSVGDWPALAGALLTVALASAPFGLATSSELPAIAFLSAAVWRLSRHPLADRDAALGGVLVALAVLTRTNLALVALAFGLLLLLAARSPRLCVSRTAWLAYGLAGLVPPLLLLLAYAAAGELSTLRLAMVDVPLAYSGQLTVPEVASQHAVQFYYTLVDTPLLFAPAVLLLLCGTGVAIPRMLSTAEDAHRWMLMTGAVGLAAVACSLLIGGAAYPHYWLQLMPFAGCFAAVAVKGAVQRGRTTRWLAVLLVLLPLAAALSASVSRARSTYSSPCDIAEAASHIRAHEKSTPAVWALHKHLIHWFLDAPQLSRASVHPDNLARHAIIDTLAEHDYVGRNEVARLMSLKPKYVVTDAAGKGVAWVRDDGADIDSWLSAHYSLDARFGDVLVYRRR